MTGAAARALSSSLRGRVLTPGDPGYAAAAGVHQLAAAARPAAIAQPADPQDVARAIGCAREHGLEIAVRGGGHSPAGHSTGDGVLVIDTRALRDLAVDPSRGRLRAGAGLTAGEVTLAAHEHGLAVPFGDTASVGIAGLTLGGGLGYLSRQHGLTVDRLLAAEVVTADGRVVTASAESEPDLFWALRGGGGNFGVVTALEFGLVRAGTVHGGVLVLPPTPDVLRGLAPLAGAAPRELGLIANIMPAPPAPFMPPAMVGRPAVMAVGVFNGPPERGEAAWAPFRSLARPIADTVGPMPYPAVYRFTETAAMPTASVSSSALLDTVDDSVVSALLDASASAPVARTIVQLRILGGAVSDRPAAETAYAHRDATAHVLALAMDARDGDAEPCRAWADETLRRLRGRAVGACVSFLGDEGGARLREAYPASTHRRLAAAKRAWDPDNVFRHNHNISPAP